MKYDSIISLHKKANKLLNIAREEIGYKVLANEILEVVYEQHKEDFDSLVMKCAFWDKEPTKEEIEKILRK